MMTSNCKKTHWFPWFLQKYFNVVRFKGHVPNAHTFMPANTAARHDNKNNNKK